MSAAELQSLQGNTEKERFAVTLASLPVFSSSNYWEPPGPGDSRSLREYPAEYYISGMQGPAEGGGPAFPVINILRY